MAAYLGPAFFNRPPEIVAQELLGQKLVHGDKSGIIVETEAYLAENDAASHAARGNTPATRALRMGPGTIYIHPMRQYVGIDIVTQGGAVLLRALQPGQGVTLPANGPGKLCKALGITKALYGLNVTAAGCPLRIVRQPAVNPPSIGRGPRVGITRATHLHLRFTLLGHPHLSR